jgi:hypothetical protein
VAPQSPVTAEELNAFALGKGYTDQATENYYPPNWAQILDGTSRYSSFNWAAALLGLSWCFWRKLYWTGLFVLAAYLLVSFLLSHLFLAVNKEQDPRSLLLVTDVPWAALLVVQGALGVFANRLYLRQALATINKVREEGPDRSDYLQRLRKKGGTHFLSFLIGVILLAAAYSRNPFAGH